MEIDPDIIIAHLTGDATDEERNALDAWRATSRRNEELFQRRAAMWKLLGELPATVPVGQDTVSSGNSGVHSLDRARAARDNGSRGRFGTWLVSAAASVLIGIVLGAFWAGRSVQSGFSAGEVITGVGEIATVTLEDGTVVRVRGESRLQFGPSLGSRDVYLDGQAYFAVPPGHDAPFRVHTRSGSVTVLGTRFDVASRADDVRVVVVQGEVEMGVGEQRVSLSASEGGRLGTAGTPIVETVDDVYRETDWVGAFLAYEATPLTEVAREFESRFGVEIVIGDPELEDRTISGWFVDQTPVEMFDSICLAVDARCDTSGDVLTMELPDGTATGAGS